ncbi:hypothetical protein, partial [Staphylococcus epidermidis]
IRKVTAQRAENNQKNNKKDNFYIISIEIVFFYLSWDFMSHTLIIIILIPKSFTYTKPSHFQYVKLNTITKI